MPRVVLENAASVRKALKAYAPDLEKQLRKEMATALKPVVRQAKSFVPSESPMSGWAARSFSEARFPFFNSQTISKGITYTTAQSKPNAKGFTSAARIWNKSAVGAIYETSGRANPNGQPWVGTRAGGSGKGVSRSVNPTAGKTFIDNLGTLTSSLQGRGRFIYRAWAGNQGVALGACYKAINKATEDFRKRAATTTFRKAA